MGIFFKKDFLVYWRDRKEMLIALLLPIALTLILGFSMPNWVENSNETFQMKAAMVIQNQHEVEIARFQENLMRSTLSTEEKAALSKEAEMFQPEVMLKQLLESDEASGFLEIITLDDQTALSHLEEEKVHAIITIPEGYTLAALNKMLLGQGDGAVLSLTADEQSMKVSILQNMLDGFFRTVNYQAALNSAFGSYGAAPNSEMLSIQAPTGGLEQIEGVDMITSFQYYALAISIFFGLSVSTTTASKSITEKREQVFMRIMLAGTHPFRYLSGKVASTFCMALLQMSVLIVLSHFIFQLFPGKDLSFWIGLAGIIILFCLSVAAFSALFTALLFRMNDADIAVGISFIVLMVFGVIGGNLVPMYILPDWVMNIGRVIPNGVTLTSLIQWIQGSPAEDLWFAAVYQGAFFVIILAVSLWIFPRRGRI